MWGSSEILGLETVAGLCAVEAEGEKGTVKNTNFKSHTHITAFSGES